MAIKITKENIDELITAYIDSQTDDPQTREHVAKMIEDDDVLKKKYKSEVLTRDILKARLKSIDVPEHTYLRVTNSIDSYMHSVRSGDRHLRPDALESSSFAQ